MIINIEEAFPGLLTRRQREVVAHLLEGKSSKETAKRLNISPRTVETYKRDIFIRLGVANYMQIIWRAIGRPAVIVGERARGVKSEIDVEEDVT